MAPAPGPIAPAVLVVEDDALIARIVHRALKAAGRTTALARDGLEALEYLRANPGTVGLILLDLRMPRMSGIDFLEARAHEPALRDIPVILVSAEGDLPHATALKVSDRFTKPFVVKDLLRAVARYLDDKTEP